MADRFLKSLSAPILVLAMFIGLGCCGPVKGLYPPTASDKQVELFVIDNHWHTSLVIRWDDLSETLKRHLNRFEGSEFVEIGWGDEGFYRAEAINSGLAIQAIFFSRGSVIHVLGLREHPTIHYTDYLVDLYRIRITEQGMTRLNDFVERAFQTSPDGSAKPIQPGLTGGYFYWARGRYSALHTCNHWLADALRTTGFPISPFYSMTSGNVSWQIRTFGRKYQNDVTVQRQ
jgi:uncharacterized protein (TIGR02117 family)